MLSYNFEHVSELSLIFLEKNVRCVRELSLPYSKEIKCVRNCSFSLSLCSMVPEQPIYLLEASAFQFYIVVTVGLLVHLGRWLNEQKKGFP